MKMNLNGLSLLSVIGMLLPSFVSSTTLLYEAENAYLHEAKTLARHDGFEGTGYVDYGQIGSYVEWTVNVPHSGDYRLSFRYSAKVSRPCILAVDGNTNPIRPIHFYETGEWDIWYIEKMESLVFLSQGTHRLGAIATTSTGPNIDWLSLHASEHEKLQSNEVLHRGEYIPSPSGLYRFGLSNNGRLILLGTSTGTVWSAGNISGIDTCKMQGDGNFVCRYNNGSVAWKSDTTSNNGAHLLVSDEGLAMIELNGDDLWSVGTTPAPNANPTTPVPHPSPVTPAPFTVNPASAVVLESNRFLVAGDFVSSPNGNFRLGISRDGKLVLQTQSGTTLWSANIVDTNCGTERADRLYMQGDGNLVIKEQGNCPLWDSDTYGNPGAQLLVTDDGKATIDLHGVALWTVGGYTQPTHFSIDPPPAEIVLEAGGFLELGQRVFSPNREYKVGLRGDGELILEKASSGDILWTAGIIEKYGTGRAFRCYLQTDGNVIVRDHNLRALWNSQTSNNPGSYVVVNDAGQLLIVREGGSIWMQGIPRSEYQPPEPSRDMTFPIRGQFYYPWYPKTWTVNGATARFEPEMGFYRSGDPLVVEQHIDMLDYSYTDLSIASWWGPDTNLDKARITLLMDKTIEMGSKMQWTVYHEDEFHYDGSPAEIRSDLDYLKQWFAWHPAWAHIDGRPVIFVYNEVGCDVATRWMDASNSEWYVVLKLFRGFRDCDVQPDSWHQYGPADAVVQIEGHSYSVSPAFWRADIAEPRLPRVSRSEFCNNVNRMVQSKDPWQLVTTFNEAGEGTMIEPSRHWASSSGYGFYLDCLHIYH